MEYNKNKKENKKNEDIVMSYEMIKNCKSDIAKYGFTGNEYIVFLQTVQAMTPDGAVLQYPNDMIEAYRSKYIKKNEYSIGDQFQFDKCKGDFYFCPRSFWDNVLKQ
jgi:hypothetical protein